MSWSVCTVASGLAAGTSSVSVAGGEQRTLRAFLRYLARALETFQDRVEYALVLRCVGFSPTALRSFS